MVDVPFAKKGLGQHWLNDPASLEAMCEAAAVQAGDVVLEIGPGYGTLTGRLLARGADVIALEFDESLIAGLSAAFANPPHGRFSVEHGDIRTYDLSALPLGYKVVANIPYYLTSNLIQLLSETSNPPVMAVLLVQKEVAERVAAEPGSMSILSVTAQFYWEVSLGREVPAALFAPPPKVDSQILIMRKRVRPLFPDADTNDFFRMVKAGFAQKRKTLLNSLSGGLRMDRQQAAMLLQTAGIDPAARAQTLSLAQWHQLYLSSQNA